LTWRRRWRGGFAVIGHNWSFLNGFKGGAGGITPPHRGDDAGAQPAGRRRDDHHRRLPDLVGAHRLDRHLCRGGRRVCVVPDPLPIDQISPWPFAIYGVMALAAVLTALRPNREKLREQKERIITLW
jgi:hypothetical protein